MKFKINTAKLREFTAELYNKKVVIIFLALAILLIYLNPFWKYYDEVVVGKILSKIESNYLTDIIFVLSNILFILAVIYSICNRKRIQNWTVFLFAFFFLLFLIERVNSGRYNFYSFRILPFIKYCDSLFFLFAGLLTLKVFNWRSKHAHPIDKGDPFIIDLPINGSYEDLYQRTQFAERLATKIQSKLNGAKAGSLAIGLNGIWGSGKSSFANLIKEKINNNEVDKKNRIVIDFNPWRSSTPSKIIEDFFELLISELGKFDPSLSRALINYAKTLTKIDENIITKTIENIADILFEQNNKNENYELINKSIERIKKQIIIFIDDLDRLEVKEIIEVLRLIRNTANFSGLVYVVSYDKGYILEAVKEFNKFNYQYFLEKIFQFEFILPRYDGAILRNFLKQILNQKLGEDFISGINSSVDFRTRSGKSLTNRIIATHRDIIRLVNSILFEIEQVKYDVNFIDFFLIQLLKIKFPDIYKIIADYHDLFFITEKSQIRLRTMDERGLGEKYSEFFNINEDKKTASGKSDTVFENHILNGKGNLTEIEKETIIEIINSLLEEKSLRQNSVSKDHRSFCNASDFHKYFIIQTLETDFPIYDLEQNRIKDYSTYYKFIFDLIEKDRLSDIQDRLEKIMDFTDKTDWENHFKILVDIGKYQMNASEKYGINYRQIIDTLNYPKSQKDKIFETIEQYEEFVRSFFKNAPDPYLFEGNILSASLTPFVNLSLSFEEIQLQLFNYLKQYCDNHFKITLEFRDLHTNVIKTKNGNYHEDNMVQKAQELFVEHYKEYLTGKELTGFIQHTEPQTDFFNIEFSWIKTFFPQDVWNDFESYIKNTERLKEDLDHYNEFMTFFEKFKLNNYQSVEYVFNHLQPSIWTNGTKTKPTKR